MQICIAAICHCLLTLLKFFILWMDDRSSTTKLLQKTSEKIQLIKVFLLNLFTVANSNYQPVDETKIFLKTTGIKRQ